MAENFQFSKTNPGSKGFAFPSFVWEPMKLLWLHNKNAFFVKFINKQNKNLLWVFISLYFYLKHDLQNKG